MAERAYALSLSAEEVARYRFMAERARRDEAADWVAAGVVPGARIADVGCGPAAISVTLAADVAPGGVVDAVDREPEALARAAEVVATAGVDNVRLSTGSADDTGLPADAYDVVMMRHVLAHNGGREQAIVDHLASLARPGGCVYLLDIEALGVRIRDVPAELLELDERYRRWHELKGNDLSVGLRLGELLAEAGLRDIHHRGWYTIMQAPPGLRPPSWAAVEAMTEAGLVSSDDVDRWAAAFAGLDAVPARPTMFVPVFAAWARRPA